MTGPLCKRDHTRDGIPRGFFLTLEGIEGSGKSTHARLLESALRDEGYRVCLTREPGGTPLGESLRDLLLSEESPVAEAELFLVLAARAEHVARVVMPRLNRGEVVISDRYADASLAYQGGGRKLGPECVAAANEIATAGLRPDLTILCNLPVEEALARVHHRRSGGGEFNRFDRETRSFYEAVQNAYLQVARDEPKRVVVVDSTGPKPEIADRIRALVLPAIGARQEAGGLSEA